MGAGHRQRLAVEAAGRVEAGEQDAGPTDQLGIVVVQHRLVVEPTAEGEHGLASQQRCRSGGGGQ
jgi:hypothetical protein